MPDDIEITPAQAAARKWLLGFYSIDECLIDAEHKRTLAEAFDEFGCTAVAAERERCLSTIHQQPVAVTQTISDSKGTRHQRLIDSNALIAEIGTATPPADRPLTADDVMKLLPENRGPNHAYYELPGGYPYLEWVADRCGLRLYIGNSGEIPLASYTLNSFAQLVAAFGINTKEPRA
jgi:hypothetical protein